jgi:hypothetical protein
MDKESTIHLILTDQIPEPRINDDDGRGAEEKTIIILMAVYALLLFGLYTLPRIAARGMFGLASAGAAGGTAILVGAAMTLTSLVGWGLTMRWWSKLSPTVRALGILPMVMTTVMLIVVAKILKNGPMG